MWNGCMMLQWVCDVCMHIYIFRIYTLGSRDFLSLLLPLLGKGKMCFHDRQAEEEDDTEEEDDPLMGFNLSAPLSQTEFSAGKLFITLWQSVLQIERREGRGGHFMSFHQCKEETAAERTWIVCIAWCDAFFWHSTFVFMRCCIEGSTCETRDGLSRSSSKLCELPLGAFALPRPFQYRMSMYEFLSFWVYIDTLKQTYWHKWCSVTRWQRTSAL